MIVRHFEVIPFFYGWYGRAVFFAVEIVGSILQRQCSPGSGTVDEGGRYLPFLVDLVLNGDTQVMFPIVFGVKRFTVIDFLSGAVKLAHCAAPSISYPSCNRTYFPLSEDLYAVTPPVAHTYHILPILRRHIRSAVFVFQQVIHLLIITLYREFDLVTDIVCNSSRHLHRVHRRDFLRHRHP